MDEWTLERDREAWLIRGADGRVVCYVQYEADANVILAAVKAAKNTKTNTEGVNTNA